MFSIDQAIATDFGPFSEVGLSPYETRQNIWSAYFQSSYPTLLPREDYFVNTTEGWSMEQPATNSRFFIIKSYTEKDIATAMKHNIWTSTELGNKRLSAAYRATFRSGGKVYLFFLVNGLGKFCGIAEMTGPVDFTSRLDIWSGNLRWNGQFTIRWMTTTCVLNKSFVHIKNPANEGKPITYARDTQEVPHAAAAKFTAVYKAAVQGKLQR